MSRLQPPKRGDVYGYGRHGYGDGYGYGGYGYGAGVGYGKPLTNALATTYACDDNHGALDAVVQRLTPRSAGLNQGEMK